MQQPARPRRIVMKFGGTSVADITRIRHVASIVDAETREQDVHAAVVVSARAGETDALASLAGEALADGPKDREADAERDQVLAAGEQISAGLLALALRARGRRARSWAGPTALLRTDEAYGAAVILGAETIAVEEAWRDGEIAVVAGFQGLSDAGRLATIGRGGSDATATALAAALKADQCDIYTDVDGVYTADPRIVERARRLDRISYEEMLEMASLGAKVLQTRSVGIAMRHQVPIRVLSSFKTPGEPNPGTWVCGEEEIMEKRVVSGVAHTMDVARVTLLNVEDQPGVAAHLFTALRDSGVVVDVIIQAGARTAKRANLMITMPQAQLDASLEAITAHQDRIGFESLQSDANVAKVSVVGVGMASASGVAATMFEALSARGINIHAVSTSEIKITVLIDREYVELAVRALHAAFELDTR